MKSRYWLGMLGKTRVWQLGAGPRETELWKCVWAIDGPSKMTHFVWMVCR